MSPSPSRTVVTPEAGGSVLRVVVRGADGALGRRVTAELSSRDDIELIELIEPVEGERCDVIVDTALADHDLLAARSQSVTAGAQTLLVDAHRLGATHLVVVSSAMVYGALVNNPVPLTEDAVLRPDPTFVFARQLAAAEEAIESWRQLAPGRSVAMLRPAITIAADATSSLANALTAGFGLRFGEADPGAQFVHLDDVASAVVLAVVRRLDGVYNVAPDGSIPGERVRALSGQRWRLSLPSAGADVLAGLRWRFQRGPIPPGLRPYTQAPWSVANDRLRAEGWAPTVTNEQAYVEGTEAKWWTTVTPKRRQELALGAMALAIAGVLAAVTVWGGRWWRSRAG